MTSKYKRLELRELILIIFIIIINSLSFDRFDYFFPVGIYYYCPSLSRPLVRDTVEN